MRGNPFKKTSVVFSTNQTTSVKLTSELHKTSKKALFPFQMSGKQFYDSSDRE